MAARDAWFLLLTTSVALSGLALLGASFLRTEAEEKDAQAMVEGWWITVDDASSDAAVRLRQLANAANRALLHVLDLVFGPRLVSLRAGWAAGFLALAAVLACADAKSPLLLSRGAILGLAVVLCGFAVLPPTDAPSRLLVFGCSLSFLAAFCAFTFMLFWAAIRHGSTGALDVLVEVAFASPVVAFGTILHLFWVGFLRWSVREFEKFESDRRAVLVFVLVLMVLYLTVVLPPLLGEFLGSRISERPREHLWMLLPMIALVKGGALAALAAWPLRLYLFIVAIFVAFRVVWPVVPRTLYGIQRHKVVQNNAMRPAEREVR